MECTLSIVGLLSRSFFPLGHLCVKATGGHFGQAVADAHAFRVARFLYILQAIFPFNHSSWTLPPPLQTLHRHFSNPFRTATTMETTTNKSSISSQVAFFKGQVFPPEIIDNIVKMIPSRLEEPTGNPGNLSDEEIETVKSCLQVSRTFRRPAREMLFGNTRIDLKINDSQYFERRFSLLASLIDGSEKTEHLYPSAAKLIKTFEMATKIPILLSASQSVSEVLNHLALANGRETNGGRLECLSMRILPFLNDDILPQSIYNLAKVASTSKSVKIIWLVGIHGIPSDTFYGAKLDLLALHDCNFVLCEEENVYANQVSETWTKTKINDNANTTPKGELVATRTNNVSRGLANLRPTFSELHWSHQGANLTFAQEAGLFGIDTARTQIYQAPRPSFDEPALEVASIKIAVSCAPPAGQINLEDYTGLSPIPATFFSFARPEMLIVCLSRKHIIQPSSRLLTNPISQMSLLAFLDAFIIHSSTNSETSPHKRRSISNKSLISTSTRWSSFTECAVHWNPSCP